TLVGPEQAVQAIAHRAATGTTSVRADQRTPLNLARRSLQPVRVLGRRAMAGRQLYDTLGANYTVTRRTDARIAARISAALGDARTVLNVGAGTGSYEPADRDVLAVEPSELMRSQRPAGA